MYRIFYAGIQRDNICVCVCVCFGQQQGRLVRMLLLRGIDPHPPHWKSLNFYGGGAVLHPPPTLINNNNKN